MNKTELVKIAAARTGVPERTVSEVLNAVLDEAAISLSEGDRVVLTGFGTFSSFERAARNARDVRSGEMIRIEPKRVVRFKPGRILREKVAAEQKQ